MNMPVHRGQKNHISLAHRRSLQLNHTVVKISLLLPPFVPPFRDFSDLRPRFAAGTKAKDGKDMGQVSVPTGVSESWAFLLPLLLAAHTQLSSVVRFFITLTQFDSLAI